MSDDITTLELGNYTLMTFKVHPSVPLQIMEAYYRKTTPYMVGTLLGHIESTHVEITNSFVVPFIEYDEDEDRDDDLDFRREEFTVDSTYNRRMFELNQKIYPKEVVVGWFTNLPELNGDAVKIHRFFQSKDSMFVGKPHIFANPLIVIVEPFAKNSVFDLKGYVSQSMAFCKETIKIFQEITLTYNFEENKTQISPLWLDSESKTNNSKSNPFELINLDNFEEQLKETVKSIERVEKYVKDVNSKKEEGDPEVGKAIKKILNALPSVSNTQFKESLNKYTQDVMMIMYLTNLANSQVLLSEKLSKIL